MHFPSGTTITRLSGRSQAQNIEDALSELRLILSESAFQSSLKKTEVARNRYTNPERSGKDFTHVFYREEVIHHASGKRWKLREWQQGRMSL